MKKLLALLLCLIMMLSLATLASAEEKTTIVFWYSLSGANADAIKAIVDNFNASQDAIFVDAQYEGEYDDAIAKLQAAGAAGTTPPCDIVHSYEIGTRLILDSGWIIPVQNFIEEDGWDTSVIEPNLLAYYTVDGKINSMPFNCSTPLLYYNKTAFDEAGIAEVPTTVDGILEIAEKLTTYDEAGNVDRYGFVFSNYGWFFEQWVGKMGREYVNNGNGRESYATEVAFGENGAALDIFKMWEKIAACPYTTNIENGGTSEARAAFCAGKTAIFLASTANLAGVLSNVGDAFEVGTAFFPYVNPDDKGGVSTGGGTLWIIDSGDEAKEKASYEFIKYCVNPENQALWNSVTGYFPINVNAQETETFKANIEAFPQFQTALDQLHASGPEYVGSLLSVFPEARQIIEDITDEVLFGNMTAEQATDAAVSQINDIIEEYNLVNY